MQLQSRRNYNSDCRWLCTGLIRILCVVDSYRDWMGVFWDRNLHSSQTSLNEGRPPLSSEASSDLSFSCWIKDAIQNSSRHDVGHEVDVSVGAPKSQF
jgi:hypothetical protein